MSGLGRELGSYSLNMYTELKSVFMATYRVETTHFGNQTYRQLIFGLFLKQLAARGSLLYVL